MLNDTFRYTDASLQIDDVPLTLIAADVGTPVYVYSLRRALANLDQIRTAFALLQPHIHYSTKANANLSVLRTLIQAGAGIDAVSGGEIYRALAAGAPPASIVFAGVGKTEADLRYALEQGVGWFNVENVEECALLDQLAGELGTQARIALRLNPGVDAATHHYIATGHDAAKFGLPADVVRGLLARQNDYANLEFAGIHLHIGSQLESVDATVVAVQRALEIIGPYPEIRTVNIGGGLPVAYEEGDRLPATADFALALGPPLRGYHVLLEPGRSIIADAGALVTRVLYTKTHHRTHFVIVDAGMTDLIRPALYNAHHEVVPLSRPERESTIQRVQLVGPVCETADVLARDTHLPANLQPGDLLAVLNAGAYGMVMASNYNARPRPAEVVVEPDGRTWRVARRRETWADLTALES